MLQQSGYVNGHTFRLDAKDDPIAKADGLGGRHVERKMFYLVFTFTERAPNAFILKRDFRDQNHIRASHQPRINGDPAGGRGYYAVARLSSKTFECAGFPAASAGDGEVSARTLIGS